jgi:hypothetical protein
MMRWDIEQYHIDPMDDKSCGIQDIQDSWDRVIDIGEIEPEK